MNISSATIDLFTRHALARSQAALSQALERLATGQRINRASDDPSGLIAAERLDAERRAVEKRIEGYELDNYRLAAKDGAMSVLSDMATELEGLVVAAANGGALSDAEREALQIEADSIIQGMNHVVSTTTFKGEKLLSGFAASNLGELTYLTTPGEGDDASGETVSYTLADLSGSLNLVDGDLEIAQRVVQKASSQIATARGAIGSVMLENESSMRAAMAELEGTTAAFSVIMDTDYAAEISNLSRAQILEQAGLRAILVGQENQRSVLSLLG